MEDFLLTVFSAIAELVCEVLCEVGLESIVALIARSLHGALDESSASHPAFAAAGYWLLGTVFGVASLLLYPHPLFHRSKLHGISLVISPVITGLVMSRVGTMIRRKGKEPMRIESFGYGFAFALGFAVMRLIFAN
jgi:hypothetical protein